MSGDVDALIAEIKRRFGECMDSQLREYKAGNINSAVAYKALANELEACVS